MNPSGAGIGGASGGTGGNITISGGNVTATSESNGAGIGRGYNGNSGTFTTTTSGTAIIKASTISDQSGKASWSGIIFERNDGAVYGDQTLNSYFEVESGKTLLIAEGATLTTQGKLANNGNIYVDGTLNGSVSGNVYYRLSLTNCTASPTYSYSQKTYCKAGDPVTLTPTLPAGYRFDYWSVTPDSVTISNNSFTMPGNAVAVTAKTTQMVKITQQPESKSVTYGERVTLGVTAENNSNNTNGITYQWYKDNKIQSDENGATLTLTKPGAGTYKYYCAVTYDGCTINSNTATVTVGKATSSVSITGDLSKTYDGNKADISYTIEQGDSNVKIEYKTQGANDSTYSTTSPEDAGDYTVRVSLPETTNYTAAYDTKNFTISPKSVTVSGITAENKTYDGSTTATLVCTNAEFADKVVGDILTVTATGAFADKDAGENKNVSITNMTLGGESAGNYILPESGQQTTATATISPKPVTVTIQPKSSAYGEDIAELTATDDGIVSGETGVYTLSTTATSESDVGSYNITGTSNSTNYDLTFTGGTDAYTITQASNAWITAPSIEGWTYGESAKTPTYQAAYGNDTVKVEYRPASGTDKQYSITVPTNAGDYKVRFSVAKTDNYAGLSETKELTISKADYGTPTANGSAMYGNPGTVDLSSYKADGGSFGTVAKNDAESVLSGDPAMEGNILKFTFADVRDNVDKTAKITVLVTGATNYNDYTITVTVTVEAKTEPTVTAPKAVDGLVYDGETHALITAGTTTEGTTLLYSLNGNDYSTELPSAVNAGDYTVYYKVKGNLTYADVDAESLTVTIAKKEVTAAPKDVTITRGSAIPAFELTYTGLLGEDTLTPSAAPTFTCYEKDGTTPVSTGTAAGTYTITWINTDIFYGETNYRVVAAPGTLTINNPSLIIPFYPPVVNQPDAGGSVTTSTKNPTAGSKVTITPKPDEGYEVDEVTVTDQNGNPVEVTDNGDGTYTFKQPFGEVTVTATFKEKTQIVFTDVPASAYYYDAVLWAAENGITGGVDAAHFAPNSPCTRAQAVTFLWRAAGCPAPKSSEMPFNDVVKGSYYYDAVLWAIENGITKGTSDTTFSPDAACTRGQIVTFLWRSLRSQASDSVNPFADMAADAYYTDAVLWAVKEDITNGTSSTTFSPDADCTRAQIVTFLYRCLGDE